MKNESLLAEGRRILAAKAAALTAEQEAERVRILALWDCCRKLATDKFGPLAEFGVEPELYPDGWNPWCNSYESSPMFYVRPFGDDGGKIIVRIHARLKWREDQGPSDCMLHSDHDGDGRLFRVETTWYIGRTDWLDAHYETTDSQAEALALCESRRLNYCEARDKLATLNAVRKDEAKIKKPTLSLSGYEIDLINAIRNVVDERLPESTQ